MAANAANAAGKVAGDEGWVNEVVPTSGFWFHEDVTPDFTVSMRLDSMEFRAKSAFQDIQVRRRESTEKHGKARRIVDQRRDEDGRERSFSLSLSLSLYLSIYLYLCVCFCAVGSSSPSLRARVRDNGRNNTRPDETRS